MTKLLQKSELIPSIFGFVFTEDSHLFLKLDGIFCLCCSSCHSCDIFYNYLQDKVFIFRGLEYEKLSSFNDRLNTIFPRAKVCLFASYYNQV